MSMWVIGIDPGVTGAVAALDHKGSVMFLHHTPTTPVVTSGKVRNKLDIPIIVEILTKANQEAAQQDCRLIVYLEQVFSRPTDGGIQGFNFGRNFGQWEGIIGTLGLPLQLVTPQTWKRHMISKTVSMPKVKESLTKREQSRLKAQVADTRKKLAIEMARNLFPNMASRMTGHKADGPAEALLLAEWGRRNEQGLLNVKPKVTKIVVPAPGDNQETQDA